MSIIRAPIVDQPLEHIQVPFSGSSMRSHVIPRARRILAAQPLEHIQVPIFSSTKTSPLIPGARRIPAAQPLEHVQVTISGSSVTSRPLISLNQIFVSLAFGERVHQNLSLPLLPFLEHSNKCKEPICSDLALALLTLNVVFEFRFTLLNWYVWAALLSEPLEHLGLALDLRKVTGLPIPGARRVLAAQPLEHIQVTIRGSSIRSNVIPRARRILAAQPLEHIQVPLRGCPFTRPLIPRAGRILAAHPLEDIQVPFFGSIATSPPIESIRQIFVSLACGERVHQNLSLPLLPLPERSNKCKEPICSDLALASLNVGFEPLRTQLKS